MIVQMLCGLAVYHGAEAGIAHPGIQQGAQQFR